MSARHGLDTTRADLMPPTTLSLNTPPSAPQIRVSPSDNVRLTNLRIVLYCIVLYCHVGPSAITHQGRLIGDS